MTSRHYCQWAILAIVLALFTLFTLSPTMVAAISEHQASTAVFPAQESLSSPAMDVDSAGEASSLHIFTLAADNNPNSGDNLSGFYQLAKQDLIEASIGQLHKTVILLSDLSGNGDTHIYVIHNGYATYIQGLPNSDGILDPTLHEYNMADGTMLGGFLKWAHENYSATRTILTMISHGFQLTPETDISALLDGQPQTSAPTNTPFPVPLHISAGPKGNLTDYTSQELISPYDLRVAFSMATNHGENPFDVIDVVHCFSASIEEFYELQPYATMLTGSPAYSYFAADMPAALLQALEPTDSPEQLAEKIVTTYDDILLDYDLFDGDEDIEYPRLMVAVKSELLARIKNSWDATSYYLMQAFEQDEAGTKEKLINAYLNSPKYDTTFCQPQDWAFGPPDGLSDMAEFARQLSHEFGASSSVGLWANTTMLQVEESILMSARQDGKAWFTPPDAPAWHFPGAGLSLYTELQSMTVDDTESLSWHAHWYTTDNSNHDNPHPYQFITGGVDNVTWATVFQRFWEGTELQTLLCLPHFATVYSTGEMAVEAVTYPLPGTVTLDTPVLLAGTVEAQTVLFNPEITFEVEQDATTVFSHTLNMGYLFTGTYSVEATEYWTPTLQGPFTLTITANPSQVISETNYLDNQVVHHDIVLPHMPRPIMTGTLTHNSQWATSDTISLDLTQDPTTLEAAIQSLHIQLYHYPSQEPSFQVAELLDVELVEDVDLDQPLTYQLPSMTPGLVVLHIWGVSANAMTQQPVIIPFNYVPPNSPLATNEVHYFHYELAENDNLLLQLTSRDVEIFAWQPVNFDAPDWSVAGINPSFTIPFAMQGTYLIGVRATSDTTYTLSALRNEEPGRIPHSSGINNLAHSVNMPTSRPIFFEPIPTGALSTVQGEVALQGRPDSPHPSYAVDVLVTLTREGELDPTYTFTRTLSEEGHLSLIGIQPDTYTVTIKNSHTLRNRQMATLERGVNIIDFGTLREGDVDNDNDVDIVDFSILATTFGKCEGDPDYDDRADFNEDGCVDIRDFSLLATNFGHVGDSPPPLVPKTRTFKKGNVALTLTPDQNTVLVGEPFTITVPILTDEAIDGVAGYLNFDTNVAEVEQIILDETLDIVLQDEFNNKNGTIALAAGTLSSTPPTSNFTFATIRFKALAPIEKSQLAFNFSAPRISDVTYNGTSILTTHTNATITIIEKATALQLTTFSATPTRHIPWLIVTGLLMMLAYTAWYRA